MTLGFDLSGRRALVTGSSEGIGAAIARRLADAGADLVLQGLGLDDGMAALAGELRERGRAVRTLALDLAAPDAADALADGAGDVDILISNVAIQLRQPLGTIDAAAIDVQVAANLRTALLLMQRVLPAMRARQWGRIVAIGSVQEARPHPDMIVYAALKAAQTSMIRNIARQVAADGVTANVIAPGVILTRRNTNALADHAYAGRVLQAIPAGRFGTSDEVAGAALLLCSDAGRYITGATIAVDGGMHL